MMSHRGRERRRGRSGRGRALPERGWVSSSTHGEEGGVSSWGREEGVAQEGPFPHERTRPFPLTIAIYDSSRKRVNPRDPLPRHPSQTRKKDKPRYFDLEIEPK